MTVTEARAYCADLDVQPWDDAADATINQAVVRATAALLSASPHVTPVPNAPGTWWIGATGFEQQDALRAACAQPVGEHAAGGARPDDDVVIFAHL